MITLESITFKNFLSTGNVSNTIELSGTGLTLLAGKNGAGKSQLLDAICFALFNRPYRKINKPQLLNSIVGKDMLVEISFRKNGHSYVVKRGMKPNVFEITKDGYTLTQAADSRDFQAYLESSILEMSFRTFGQIVVIGRSNYIPFMELTPAARREVIEDLLDLKVFGVMNAILKEDVSSSKDSLKDIEMEVTLEQSKKALSLKHAEESRQKTLDIIGEKEAEIAKQESIMANLEAQRSKTQDIIDDLVEKHKATKNVSKQENKLRALKSSLADSLLRIEKSVTFYDTVDVCPTCNGHISEEHRHSAIYDLEAEKIEVNKKLEGLDSVYVAIKEKQEKHDALLEELSVLREKLRDTETKMSASAAVISATRKDIEREIQREQSEKNLSWGEREERHLDSLVCAKETLLINRESMALAAMLLKDTGIKSKIIKNYVPMINGLINEYLSKMDFFCSFEIDENFEEKILARNRDTYTYGSFSEGEKMRINLALLFTWREIARIRHSASINLLLFDEVMDSSLDVEGTDSFLSIIAALSGKSDVFVISHKVDQISDKFDRVLRVEKQKNFSHIT